MTEIKPGTHDIDVNGSDGWTPPYRKSKPSMRDRLLEACEPWDLPDGASIESSVVRNAHEIADAVLAVLADPDDETVRAVARGLSLDGSVEEPLAARDALAALAEHLRGEES